MEILFSDEKLESDKREIKALFCYDAYSKTTSVEMIIQTIRSFLPPERRENIKFKKLYIGGNIKKTFYNSNSGRPQNIFYVLVGLKNGCLKNVLKASNDLGFLNDICGLLENEVNDESKSYMVLEVPGELEE